MFLIGLMLSALFSGCIGGNGNDDVNSEAAPNYAGEMSENEGALEISNSDIEIKIQKSQFAISVLDNSGKTIFESAKDASGKYAPMSYCVGLYDGKSLLGFKMDAEAELSRYTVGEVTNFYKRGSAFILECSTDEPTGDFRRHVEIHISFIGEKAFSLKAFLTGTRINDQTYVYNDDVFKFAAAFASPSDELFFGMGRQTERVQQRGHILDTWLREGAIGAGKYKQYIDLWKQIPGNDQLGEVIKQLPYVDEIIEPMGADNATLLTDGTASHWTYPFFISSKGYGFLLNMSEPAFFDFAATREDALNVEAYANHYEFVFFYGPEPMDVIQQQAKVTGLQPLPPVWAFAPWMSRNIHENTNELYEDRDGMRKYDIPCSIIVFDSPWDTHYHDYEFNPIQVPDPKTMIDDMHAAGYKVVLWHSSFMNCDSGNYQTGLQNGYYVNTKLGVPYITNWWKCIPQNYADAPFANIIDLTNPEAATWWKSLLQKVLDYGIDGFKDDGAEYVPEDSVLWSGRTGLEMHNLYPTYYNKAVFEACEANLEEFIVDPRAGYAGTQKWCNVMWAGDQSSDWDKGDGFPTVVISGLALGICGVPFYGHDVGGYTDETSDPLSLELFIRWAQFGALSPVMQIHSKRNLAPWDFGENGTALYRQYAKLHTQLIPYTYTLAKMANSTGIPIMRHPFLVHPEDPKTAIDSFTYYYGDSLFVAPFYEPGEARKIYFPLGDRYIDWYTGEIYEGGAEVEYKCGLDRMPLFIVEGSAIPMFHDDVDTLAPGTIQEFEGQEVVYGNLNSDLTIKICPKEGTIAEFTLYDGTDITFKAGNGRVDITLGSNAERSIDFEIIGDWKAYVDGKAIN